MAPRICAFASTSIFNIFHLTYLFIKDICSDTFTGRDPVLNADNALPAKQS
jgi:hypothetical protein